MDPQLESFECRLQLFERRMTRRLYAVGVAIVVAVALLRHFWT
ncbi:hypothetical protein [Pararobbsia alpina]|uniref:Uncharacterized protein n=1 Tax=Pararobbsia alpina TaxID=621374 RepID=A0A6S7BLW8_9BURK|nr:hypothetical protein [Pararobbsia alpina]CAB3805312.1 hypothetical protein LMG28138_05646 [Pararobbsia alpina]